MKCLERISIGLMIHLVIVFIYHARRFGIAKVFLLRLRATEIASTPQARYRPRGLYGHGRWQEYETHESQRS